MDDREAIRRSRVAIQVEAAALALLVTAYCYLRWWQLGASAGFVFVYTAMDAINILRRRRRLRARSKS
jgi:hypothetical protein